MTDLTMEYHPVCKHLADWWDEWREPGQKPEPPECRWEQLNDGDTMASGRCPKCGGEVEIVGYAV